MSPFQMAADVLHSLKVFKWVTMETYVLACSLDEVKSLAEQNWPSGPSFRRVLAVFREVIGEYAARTSEVFTEPIGDIRTFNALVELGYVETAGKGFLWSAKCPELGTLPNDPHCFSKRQVHFPSS